MKNLEFKNCLLESKFWYLDALRIAIKNGNEKEACEHVGMLIHVNKRLKELDESED